MLTLRAAKGADHDAICRAGLAGLLYPDDETSVVSTAIDLARPQV